MSGLINRIQLPTKCSTCGNKMFRAQWTEFGDKRVHSVDYCAYCQRKLDWKFTRGFEAEREIHGMTSKIWFLLVGAALVISILYIIQTVPGIFE